eukprot:CAMPEP_0182426442 /NCGR_PEP_ID=MMETSP1167-20130531/12938_1 /TAXON_ID=2988 /ORGANISM="Mallomonas Sp, Strain CCMP3275" /LENGTH=245 /DNA_ID=CAMNT_0024607869 /DNA_START=62 /DNA_END=796 /DNA_ORIENTATION=+
MQSQIHQYNVEKAQEEALDTKRIFVRYVSHEIRTPLSIVSMGIGFLKSQLMKNNCTDDTADVIEEMRVACMASLDVLNELLSYEKLESGLMRLERTLTPVWSLLTQSLQPLASTARVSNISLKFKCKEGDVCKSDLENIMVRVDMTKVCMALKNLISNAIKHTQKGGSVSMTVQCLNYDKAKSDGRQGIIRVLVTDTGIGMTEETQFRLFKEGETGLGLWLAKTIIELHNGSISCMSRGLGEGSI